MEQILLHNGCQKRTAASAPKTFCGESYKQGAGHSTTQQDIGMKTNILGWCAAKYLGAEEKEASA